MAYLHLEVTYPSGMVKQYLLKVNNKKDTLPAEFIPIIAKRFLKGDLVVKVMYVNKMESNGVAHITPGGSLWRSGGHICWGTSDRTSYGIFDPKTRLVQHWVDKRRL